MLHQRPTDARGVARPAVPTTEHRLEVPAAPAAPPPERDRRPAGPPAHECPHERVTLHCNFTSHTAHEKVTCRDCGRQLRESDERAAGLFQEAAAAGAGRGGGFGGFMGGRGRGGRGRGRQAQPTEDRAWQTRVRGCPHPPEMIQRGRPGTAEATRYCGRCGTLLRPPLDDDDDC